MKKARRSGKKGMRKNGMKLSNKGNSEDDKRKTMMSIVVPSEGLNQIIE